MAGTITGVFHAVIAVPDLDVALLFYRDLLGLTVTLRWDHDAATLSKLTGYADPVASAATLAAPDGTEIELAEFRRPQGRPRVEKRWEDAGLSFITLTCDNLGEVVARLRAAGTRFVGDIVDYVLEDGAVVRVVYCFAPEGTTITLIELPHGRARLAVPDAHGAGSGGHGTSPVKG
jgi:catechol 2,3-dioxygenase-like lactoylglutathione lyase family enzyme